MKTKDDILREIRNGLEAGTISKSDLLEISRYDNQKKTIVDIRQFVQNILFYIVGIILYVAVLSAIWQTPTESFWLHMLMSVGIGLVAWSTAHVVNKWSRAGSLGGALSGSLLLMGSLLLATGVFYITRELDEDNLSFLSFVPGAAALSIVHAGAYALMRRDILFILSVFSGVSTIGLLALWLVGELAMGADIGIMMTSFVIISSLALLVYAQRVCATKRAPHLKGAFDEFAVFFGLLAMYCSTYTEFGGLWYLLLVVSIFGVYYISTRTKKRIVLITASLFLVLTILTVSFRYFEDFGITTSLIVSAIGLMGVGVLTANIGKRYNLK